MIFNVKVVRCWRSLFCTDKVSLLFMVSFSMIFGVTVLSCFLYFLTESYIAARNTLISIIKFSSAYETETEFERGMRRKTKRKRILSSSESEEDEAAERKRVRLNSKIYIPPPPPVPALESTSPSGPKNSQKTTRSKNYESNAKAKKGKHNMHRAEIESSFPSRGSPKRSR